MSLLFGLSIVEDYIIVDVLGFLPWLRHRSQKTALSNPEEFAVDGVIQVHPQKLSIVFYLFNLWHHCLVLARVILRAIDLAPVLFIFNLMVTHTFS